MAEEYKKWHCDWTDHWYQRYIDNCSHDRDACDTCHYNEEDDEYDDFCDHECDEDDACGKSIDTYEAVPGSTPCEDEYCRGAMKNCPNYIMCGKSHPIILFDCWGGRCNHCDTTIGLNLVFQEREDTCVICMETEKMVEFPQCPANHTIGVTCLSKIVSTSEAGETRHLRCPMCRSDANPPWHDKNK